MRNERLEVRVSFDEGRRFYYLALSYGYIQPDMGDCMRC
jgi:hypothetical protein